MYLNLFDILVLGNTVFTREELDDLSAKIIDGLTTGELNAWEAKSLMRYLLINARHLSSAAWEKSHTA